MQVDQPEVSGPRDIITAPFLVDPDLVGPIDGGEECGQLVGPRAFIGEVFVPPIVDEVLQGGQVRTLHFSTLVIES